MIARRLRERAHDFELMAWAYADRAAVDPRQTSCTAACLIVAIVLEVVADELDASHVDVEELAA